MLGQLVESDYLLDFDIFHVSHVTELLHYIDAKYLSSELGGTNDLEVDTWLNIQVPTFIRYQVTPCTDASLSVSAPR